MRGGPGRTRIAASVRLHEAILDALADRDLVRARRSLRQHWLADLEEVAARTGVSSSGVLKRETRYQEFAGGHDPIGWRSTLPDGLRWFLGR